MKIKTNYKTHKSIKKASTFGEMSADVQNGVFDYLCCFYFMGRI